MAKYYQINDRSIVIKPLMFLVPIGIAVTALFILLPLVTITIMVKGNFAEIEAKYFAGYLLLIPFLLACLLFFTYGRRQVIFDSTVQTISLKTIFGKKQLMRFNEVASIDPHIRFGLVYYLKSTNDRYGKGYRISPSFTGEQDKDKHHFDTVVLPSINSMINSIQELPLAAGPSLIDLGVLNYYTINDVGYKLKRRGISKFVPALIFFGLLACYFWYNLFTKITPTDNDKQLSAIVLLPIAIFVLTVSKRVVFDLNTKKIKVYRIGILFKNYAFDNFAGFSIVRKTYNGLYNGTDVRLKFNKRTGTSELTLADFGKTNPIENFIAETEFVLKKMKKP